VISTYAKPSGMSNPLSRSGQNRGIVIAVAAFLLLSSGVLAQTTYKDPGGSFTVSVPAGWNAQKGSDSSQVTISKGTASVSFDVEPTDDGSTPPPKEVLAAIEKQVVQQCPQAEVVKHGDATLAGQPGALFKLTCKDPKHGTAMMTIAVATTNGKVLVGNMTAYSGEYASLKPVMEGIAGSIRLGDDTAMRRAAGAAFTDAMRRQEGDGPRISSQDADGTAQNGNAQKLKALDGACSSGVLTPDECAAKKAALTKAGKSSNSSGSDAQLQALKRACDAGVFTPQECQAKLAALSEGGDVGGGTNPGANANSNSNPNGWQSNDPSARPPGYVETQRNGNYADPEQTGGGGGNLYKDARGAFSVMIPQGWSAKPNSGCYGPEESCPRGATGVNINSRGKSWAFVAPFSGDARRPTDVVNAVAEHIRSDYQNFQMLQNDPDKLNGMDIAIGHFTGVENGEGVSLVVIGIAAPNGRFFVVESSVPQSELQSAGPALSSMPGTLRFAGQ
jgi:hypothetical protein